MTHIKNTGIISHGLVLVINSRITYWHIISCKLGHLCAQFNMLMSEWSYLDHFDFRFKPGHKSNCNQLTILNGNKKASQMGSFFSCCSISRYACRLQPRFNSICLSWENQMEN